MPVGRKDITISQRGGFRLVITVLGGPESLVGYTGEMQVRSIKASPTVLAEATPEMFTIDDLNGQVVLEIPGEETELYDWDNPAVYDLYIVNGEDRWRLVEGRAILSKTVTRED